MTHPCAQEGDVAVVMITLGALVTVAVGHAVMIAMIKSTSFISL
ncbi:Unknown protein sequence [Pseudomonas amygdali pv. lachrymans]|uniref:Uncharacterized protein n=1 Tax=Pseudomonas amygdali pv. lachrymans TaxID=53707 RepID=A0ABR5KQK0_PSEAV|nr:Unknown protein sequence [Pseudomonas amygdali pv. lachrymans]KPC17831.1 Unknown protein sequence [Pseudomonas amygdali pv. lachrymans]RMT06241.1 hypothetical protein ALP54_102725 [Pseudomonas amygdali pv. lachrymans]